MTATPRIPELRAGDVLTRSEFERRYSAMPQLKKAELIEGVVFMPSRVRFTQHARPHALLAGWLVGYAAATSDVEVSVNATVRLDLDNEPQPDLLLRRTGPGASSRIDADGHLTGTPEFVAEVAASSASYDLHHKLRVYRRAGVLEYLVLRSVEDAVDWFVLRDGTYERLAPAADGTLRSETFAGLWLDTAALLRADAAALRAAVTAGLRARDAR